MCVCVDQKHDCSIIFINCKLIPSRFETLFLKFHISNFKIDFSNAPGASVLKKRCKSEKVENIKKKKKKYEKHRKMKRKKK